MIRIIAILVIFASLAYAAHGHWLDHYTNAQGISCCVHAQDCKQMPVSLVAFHGEMTTVQIGNVVMTLPAKSVHVSEDAQTYVCTMRSDGPAVLDKEHVRCAFYAVGG